VLLLVGCSDLLDRSRADVVVRLEAADEPAVTRVRQDALAGAPAWGGVRVGERTGDVGESALEFTLPGENLDLALGALRDLDARVVSTEIDVDAEQIERTTTTAAGEAARNAPAEAGRVRLRVEVTRAAPGGADAAARTVMSVFSIIGLIATVRWIREMVRSRRRRRERPRTRRIERLDLRDDPPTQENPRVPPGW
jgi:hypothetical protein